MCYRFYIDKFFKRKVDKVIAERGIYVPDDGLALLSDPKDVHPTERALVIAANGSLTMHSVGALATAPHTDALATAPHTAALAGATPATALAAQAAAALWASAMSWGFASPVSNGVLANARSESVTAKPTFRESALKRRCVIPASGFYEWNEHKARFRFFREDDELLWLAGIYRPENGTNKFTILTREAAGTMVPVHPRMPVTVEAADIASWITDDGFMEELFDKTPGYLAREQDEGQISMMF